MSREPDLYRQLYSAACLEKRSEAMENQEHYHGATKRKQPFQTTTQNTKRQAVQTACKGWCNFFESLSGEQLDELSSLIQGEVERRQSSERFAIDQASTNFPLPSYPSSALSQTSNTGSRAYPPPASHSRQSSITSPSATHALASSFRTHSSSPFEAHFSRFISAPLKPA
jgi:hypothetical protein